MTVSDSTGDEVERGNASQGRQPQHLALAIGWSRAEPQRAGEVTLFPASSGPRLIGRGGARDDDPAERVRFARQRPGIWEPTGDLAGSALSRAQLLVTPSAGTLKVQRLGRLSMCVNGALKQDAELKLGDTVTLGSQLLLICVRRTARIAPLKRFPPSAIRAFGEADAYGMIGESPTTWALRESIAFAALSKQHCLVLGESGTGKELAARMIHQLGVGASRSMVSRNAATFPEALVDAELFGNIKDYPNPGMPGRPGLIGASDQSSLFLDEIAEFPEALQAHLLRVLDSGGEYQRLGDAQTRSSNFRLICATNRSPGICATTWSPA